MNNRLRGKKTERAVAERIGGVCVGILGKEDIQVSDWSVEVKHRKVFAGEKFLLQSERNCPKGKTPIVIVHLHGKEHSKDIVMMRLRDWEAWNGSID
jgi:hypothetical protein